MATVFIGVGSNLGDRAKNIDKAVECLGQVEGITVVKVSSLKETKPQNAAGPDYLNGVIKVETSHSPQALLLKLQECEKEIGRRRTFKNAPRIIDLDILLYDSQVVDEPDLKIPHPLMFERDFVMNPLLEIEPKLVNTIKSLRKNMYRI